MKVHFDEVNAALQSGMDEGSRAFEVSDTLHGTPLGPGLAVTLTLIGTAWVLIRTRVGPGLLPGPGLGLIPGLGLGLG